MKKTEKGNINLNVDGFIKQQIKSGDSLVFELNLDEIWVDIHLQFFINNNLQSSCTFELKIKFDSKIDDLINNLKCLAIRTFKYNNQTIYYLFSNFEILVNGNKLESEDDICIEYQISELFNLDTKVHCKIYFLNLNSVLYEAYTESEKANTTEVSN